MVSFYFFLFFIPLLAIILLTVNFIFAPHKPYKEKDTPFECGYHSFLGQTRVPFDIIFGVIAIVFLIFGVEIFIIFPYALSSSYIGINGLVAMLIFALVLSIGLFFEIGKKALSFNTKGLN